MKITFILPAIGKKSGEPYIKTWRLMEPLTISTLASMIPDGVKTAFFDDRIELIDYDEVTDAVIIPVEMYTARRAYIIGKEYKARGIPVIYGGYHPTLMPEEAIKHGDSVVIGNAEHIIDELLNDIANHTLKEFYCGENGFKKGMIPDRTIYGNKKYSPLALIETGRGCVFNCEFCTITSAYQKKYYRRDIEDIVNDIKKSGKKYIFFVDDNIVADEDFAIELFKALVPLKIRWSGQGSLTMARNDELLKWMKKSGCMVVLIGFESMNPLILKQMNKSWAFQSDERDYLTDKIHSYGIGIYATFVFGYDFETEEDYEEALKFAVKQDFFFVAFNHLLPFPGTRLHDRLLSENRLVHPEWWLQSGYKYGDIPYIVKGEMEGRVSEKCREIRHRYFSLRKLPKRTINAVKRYKDIITTFVFLSQNFNLKKEIDEKLMLPIGDGLDEYPK